MRLRQEVHDDPELILGMRKAPQVMAQMNGSCTYR